VHEHVDAGRDRQHAETIERPRGDERATVAAWKFLRIPANDLVEDRSVAKIPAGNDDARLPESAEQLAAAIGERAVAH